MSEPRQNGPADRDRPNPGFANTNEFTSGNVRVRMSFAGKCDVADAVAHYLAMRANVGSAMGREL